MATLEKIRSKSVLLFIIIIVALLAFILGDFLTSGRTYFGTGDTVAKAGGVKVDYNTYRDRLNANSDAQKSQGRSQDPDVVSEQTIEELLLEGLLNQEYDRMGITVTDKQLSQLMMGTETGPQVFGALMQQFGQGAQLLVEKGVVDVRNYYDAMKNPAKYGLGAEEGQVMTQVWKQLEDNIIADMRQSAYGVLINGLFAANKVDAKAMYNERNTTTRFAYVRKDFSTIPDDQVKVTDEDYKKVYDEHKGAYRLTEEQRALSVIAVPIVPSDADLAKGQSEVETVIAELKTTEGLAALHQHPDFTTNTGKYTRAELDANPQLKTLALDSVGLSAGKVALLSGFGGNYNIAKVLDITSGIPNVKFSVMGGLANAVDSLVAKANTTTFDSIATSVGGNVDLALSLINPQAQLNDAQKAALAQRPVGQIFVLNDTVKGQDKDGKATEQIYATAFLIKERDAAVPVYEVATAQYQVVPSSETVTDLNTRLHAYVGNNAEAKAFADNASKSNYTVFDAIVSPSTPLVGQLPSSRGAVKWAMNNKKGKVSPVFRFKGAGQGNQNSEYLMALAVTDVYDGQYIPVDAKLVKENLRNTVMLNKKAEKVIDQYKGKAKDLAGYAKLMGAPVAETEAVFGDEQISGIGYAEQTLMGQVNGAEKGKVVGPVQGNNAVYVITVKDVQQQGRPFDLKENQQAFSQKYVRAMMSDPLRMILGNNKVKNNVLEFVADEAN